ncbi:hypothetical protein FisN_2Lh137 [Fistulifera solaris]|uniref:Uncharacterized protein n=1 Tax=Fistulifera solaris TaxID=1519565 RepID=A0A1Z5JWT6_FISSO|nr:hypothetical protein FisN_2Lh137 [Fistulifera solaris]|eukprot:GAX18480.1 hypothetical protein FisN_2Lh137 [Fistulifera solaris]
MSTYKKLAPTTIHLDEEYDYQPTTSSSTRTTRTTTTPTLASAEGWRQMRAYHPRPITMKDSDDEKAKDGEEALLDLAQLEELQKEAEQMKARGNQHMAAQEYARAYSAYSAALQLAPVGPSSHIFLSNRAAALLSLKRYPAAATDARRAIALAPTFGKAHARLGQALYFQKQYAAAVAAYQDALTYEPDNAVTQSYLEKAKYKFERAQRKEVESVSTQLTPSHSVFTDHAEPQTTAVIRQTAMHSGRSALVSAAAARDTAEDEDPDFEEALRIQKRANDYLTKKQYKAAIEEYTAALFLVPDDFHLSPDLHLGRAHALNGSRRHESARNDCLLAIKLNPSPAAYSTLAKSLFYMREYAQAVDAFEKCQDLLPDGETLGMFDQAYLEKAKAALEEEEYSLKEAGTVSGKSSYSKTVPKLPPPRFVPREEALQAPPQVPPMPKSWPQQSPTSTTFHCGEERTIVFGSEALGVKLNRGSDGIVRVLHVTPSTPGSLFVRHGDLYVGDVVREAAGVDLRRPLTNVMWGDTVALIKLAPRPITMLVAKELSPVPAAVLQEHERELAQWPSPSSGEEAVEKDAHSEIGQLHSLVDDVSSDGEDETTPNAIENEDDGGDESTPNVIANDDDALNDDVKHLVIDETTTVEVERVAKDGVEKILIDDNSEKDESDGVALNEVIEESLRDKEERMLGGEVIFTRTSSGCDNWDTLRWMSYAGIRRLQFTHSVFRVTQSEKLNLFWKSKQEDYCERQLLVYDEPALILIVRRAESIEELVEILDISSVEIGSDALEKYWVAESVIDLSMCKIGLSPLTSFSLPHEGTERMQSCFTLFTPLESILLSAVKGSSFSDSEAFLETTTVEMVISKALCAAHQDRHDSQRIWKHQFVLGTLHALVVSGRQQDLENALLAATKKYVKKNQQPSHLPSEVVDRVDEKGFSALQLACFLGMSAAVKALVDVGANVSLKTEEDESSLAHLCVRNLDDNSLSVVLSVQTRKINPNCFTSFGRSPMYTAVMEGRKAGRFDSDALRRCLLILKRCGGEFGLSEGSEVVKSLACSFRHEDLTVVLQFCPLRFPLPTDCSLNSFYGYPLHHSMLCLTTTAAFLVSSSGVQTVSVLLNHGFEPNERMDFLPSCSDDYASEYVGYTPLQVLASIGTDMKSRANLCDPDEFSVRMKTIQDVACCLIRNGGRLAVDNPFTTRSRVINYVDVEGRKDSAAPVREFDLLLFDVIELFGGKNKVNAARDEFISLSACRATPFALISSDNKSAIPNSGQPGGSDEKSCAICWKSFGTIRNRQHRCRISRRYVCDDCSTKRVKDEFTEHRVSDGQFLFGRFDALNAGQICNAPEVLNKVSATRVPSSFANKGNRTVQEDLQNRDSLFGGIIEEASNLMFGDGDEKVSSGVAGITGTLNETRDALNERGGKIDSLAEKSEKMVEASANFADMAKQLRKQTEGGFFW